MEYLKKSFSVYPTVKKKTSKREGRTTYSYCKACEKVHEVGVCAGSTPGPTANSTKQ